MLAFTLTSCAELLEAYKTVNTITEITQGEAVQGLKQALEFGVNNGTSSLGKEGGFLKNAAYKILMPPEVQNAVDKIRGSMVANALAGPALDKMENAMNTGAEKAMAEAKPIFVNAIKQMTITDALNIVKGGDGAATDYLKRVTSAQLKEKFRPVIKSSLDKVNINDPWTKVTTAYNMVMGKKVTTDLNDYVTENAMSALFTQIKQEEDKIRANPAARTTDILKKVFNYADQNK
jgi:hypothetical protein